MLISSRALRSLRALCARELQQARACAFQPRSSRFHFSPVARPDPARRSSVIPGFRSVPRRPPPSRSLQLSDSSASRFDAGVVCAIAAGCILAGVSLGLTAARSAYRPPLLEWFDARDPAQRSRRADVHSKEYSAKTPAVTRRSTLAGRRVVGHRARRTAGIPPGFRLRGRRGCSRSRGRMARRPHVRLSALLRTSHRVRQSRAAGRRAALARRGIVLVGRSRARRWWMSWPGVRSIQEAAAAFAPWARLRLARYVGRWSQQSGRDCGGHPDRRSVRPLG